MSESNMENPLGNLQRYNITAEPVMTPVTSGGNWIHFSHVWYKLEKKDKEIAELKKQIKKLNILMRNNDRSRNN